MRTLKLITLAFPLLLAGCLTDSQTSQLPAMQGCPAGTAEIQMGDGYFEVICGCAEPVGTLVTPGTSLTCTVPTGTQVFFQAVGIQSLHQIIAVHGDFPAGPVFSPDSADPEVYPVHFPTSGTFDFADMYDSALAGQIVVP